MNTRKTPGHIKWENRLMHSSYKRQAGFFVAMPLLGLLIMAGSAGTILTVEKSKVNQETLMTNQVVPEKTAMTDSTTDFEEQLVSFLE